MVEPTTLADKWLQFSNDIEIDEDPDEEEVTGNILPPELYEISDDSEEEEEKKDLKEE